MTFFESSSRSIFLSMIYSKPVPTFGITPRPRLAQEAAGRSASAPSGSRGSPSPALRRGAPRASCWTPPASRSRHAGRAPSRDRRPGSGLRQQVVECGSDRRTRRASLDGWPACQRGRGDQPDRATANKSLRMGGPRDDMIHRSLVGRADHAGSSRLDASHRVTAARARPACPRLAGIRRPSARRNARAASGDALAACTAPATRCSSAARPAGVGQGDALVDDDLADVEVSPISASPLRRGGAAGDRELVGGLRLDDVGDAEPRHHARDLRARKPAPGRIGMHDRARVDQELAQRVRSRDVGHARAGANRQRRRRPCARSMRLPATRLPALSSAAMAGAGRMIASGRWPAASRRCISAIVALVTTTRWPVASWNLAARLRATCPGAPEL